LYLYKNVVLYEEKMTGELRKWQKRMLRKPSYLNRLSKKLQDKINSYIPEKAHKAITSAIKQMVRGVLFGAKLVTSKPQPFQSVEQNDLAAEEKIKWYQKTAAIEGGLTGAGGILLGLADFPLLISIKLKLLFDIASVYGYQVSVFKERLFILHIFQLAFSSDLNRKEVYQAMTNWEEKSQLLPDDINEFDWRRFQQEYRDYIDIAKMAQLIPVIGAPVGAVVNYRLIRKLGNTAKNAYRQRWLEQNPQLQANYLALKKG